MTSVARLPTTCLKKPLPGVRLEGMERFKDSMIVFPAKDEKHTVTVFTDTSCGYCRKLHSEMAGYNEAGITVRYLAFPRSGTTGPTFDQMKAIWCSKDTQDAMTQAKAGERLDTASIKMCDAPVAEQYAMGQKVGVTGTPAIIMPDGTMIPGYQDPARLAANLNAQ